MPRPKKQQKSKEHLSPQKRNEAWGLVFLAISALVFIALISYDQNDLPFYSSDPNLQTKNLIGIIGSYIAGALVFLIGATSFVVPLLTLSWAMSKFMGKEPQKIYIKAIGTIILFLSASSFFSLLSAQEAAASFKNGGFVGALISGYLARYFGYSGTYIILVTLVMLSILIATEFLIFPLAVSLFGLSSKFFVFVWKNIFARIFQRKPGRIIVTPKVRGITKDKEAPPVISKPKIIQINPESIQPKSVAIKAAPATEASAGRRKQISIDGYKFPPLGLLSSPPPIEERRIKDDLE